VSNNQNPLEMLASALAASLAATYPDKAAVDPDAVRVPAIQATRDAEAWGPVAEVLFSPRATDHAVVLEIIRPPKVEGAQPESVAEIAGRLDVTTCKDANELLQAMTVIGFITSPDVRARLYVAGYRVNGKLIRVTPEVTA
jgi:hypothetical protein